MKKDILKKAIRLADKRAVRPEKVVIASPSLASGKTPASTLFAKKPAAEIMSERLYTRITPREMKRLKACLGSSQRVSELLRELLLDYLDKQDRKHGRKKA